MNTYRVPVGDDYRAARERIDHDEARERARASESFARAASQKRKRRELARKVLIALFVIGPLVAGPIIAWLWATGRL